jgi:hypothetical protein
VLIHLDGSAAADVTSGSADASRSHTCIENLLTAHFHGNHVLSLLPSDVDALRAAPWSLRARRALEDIDEKYAEIAGLRKRVPWSLELGVGPVFAGDVRDVDGRRVIRAQLHGFAEPHTTSCSTLLGENATDADLFQELGLMRLADRAWQVAMVHEARGTGGSTFAPEFARVVDRGHIALAVADSDKRHPNDDGGGTYGQLEAKARGRPAYQRARPLSTRTAEGIVPLDVYEDVFQTRRGDQRLGSITRLRQLLRSAPADILQYAHLKDGIRLHQVESPKTEAEGVYWSDIAKRSNRDQCTRSSAEQCTKREACGCYVVDALGGGALADVVAWMKTQRSKKKLAALFGLSQRPDLSTLADEVLAWGLALSGLRT